MNALELTIDNTEPEKIINLILEEFPKCYLYCSKKVYIFNFEKYYFRICSSVLTEIILDFTTENKCEVVIISGGGRSGFILLTTRGAEEHRNNEVLQIFEKICESNSWNLSLKNHK
ncbi:MAG: hypothetical protein ACTSO9_13085 [Candidatus Helarchaeota archaeon]